MTTHVEQIEWHRCYDDSWKGFIVPEAFTHPAKFARGLITRIYTHMLAEGMLKRGDSVVDPFGGIGTGGIIAASYGLSWYGCELESKFHALAQQNFAMHMHMWMQFGDQAPVLVCGDSRKLRDNLAGVLPQAVVASPPFTGGTDTQGRGEKLLVDASAKHRHKTRLIQGSAKEYGNTPGQLDGLPAGYSPPPPHRPTSSRRVGRGLGRIASLHPAGLWLPNPFSQQSRQTIACGQFGFRPLRSLRRFRCMADFLPRHQRSQLPFLTTGLPYPHTRS